MHIFLVELLSCQNGEIFGDLIAFFRFLTFRFLLLVLTKQRLVELFNRDLHKKI